MPLREGLPFYAAPDADRFPADQVLWDLRLSECPDPGHRTERILARYAVLRHWLLRQAGAPMAVTRHAREAARAHLVHFGGLMAPAVWREGELLHCLLEAGPTPAVSLLAAAAVEAGAGGDPAGAAALAGAAQEAALRPPRNRGHPDPS